MPINSINPGASSWLKRFFEKDSDGEEYDNLVAYQSITTIDLMVKKLNMKVIHYYAFVDKFHRVIEVYTTEDGRKWANENEWPEMNDIEKHVCRKRGWDLDRFFECQENRPLDI